MNIILASGSPRRKLLLRQINFNFTVQISTAKEDYDPTKNPAVIVKELALRKAQQVADKYNQTDALIIGADTIVVLENTILEKPATKDEAHEMLTKLSGNTHQVLTGVALIKNVDLGNKQQAFTFVERTDVTFGELDDFEMQEYVQTGSPMDKAGAYGIQDDWGALFVEKINGDYYNVVGFPLHAFYKNMKSFAPEYLPHSIKESNDED